MGCDSDAPRARHRSVEAARRRPTRAAPLEIDGPLEERLGGLGTIIDVVVVIWHDK